MRVKKPFRGIVYTVSLESTAGEVAVEVTEPLTDEGG
jgi:hypothetical protein